MNNKKYKLGYVPGVYDLFHIGHLNLIRRAKEQSQYLLAGVLSDELVEHFKQKRPVVPFEERIAIVEAIKDVDRVVKVDFANTIKMDAWKLYHYDAYFSGDDHIHDWDQEREELRRVGSDIVFLPYTQGTSSTMLKEEVKQAKKKNRLYLFGAGRIGQRVLTELNADSECGQDYADRTGKLNALWTIAGFLDNQPDKHLTRINGMAVYRPEDLLRLEGTDEFGILITMKEQTAAREQLKQLGLEEKIIG